jgi:hypothetical protein
MDSVIVGYTERESMDPITGAEGVLRKEWKVEPLALVPEETVVAAFGPDWRRWSPGASWVLSVRYIRRGKEEEWSLFQTANSRGQALQYVDDRAVATDPELAALQKAREVHRQAEEERARVKAVQAEERRLDTLAARRSEAAFERLLAGKGGGWALGWQRFIEAHAADADYCAAKQGDTRFMELYSAVLRAMTVPAKRKALRAFLTEYGKEFMP